jgi:hypothetical protein
MRDKDNVGIMKNKQSTDYPFLIFNNATFHAWTQRLYSLTWTHNLPIVQFKLLSLTDEENKIITAKINHYLSECGCTSGSLTMNVTAVFLILIYFISGQHLSDINLNHIFYFIGIVVCSAFTGKLFGLFWARWRLIRLITKLKL